MESAVEIVHAAKELQEMGVGYADTAISPRPKRWPALHERRICEIEYQTLTIRAIGERIGAEKLGVCRPKHAKIGSRQADCVVINVGDRAFEALQRVVNVGRVSL